MESKSIDHMIYIHGSDAVSPILNIAHRWHKHRYAAETAFDFAD